jgi:NADPH:quinone reductase-like Zn-dependent oxidoreductase
VPESVDLTTAGAWPVVGLTAWQALHRAVPVAAGARILVLGAGGAVGQQLVQIGRHRGASVAGVAARRHHARLAALGADRLEEALGAVKPGSYDIVVDCAGLASEAAAYRPLRRGGHFLGIADEPDPALAWRHDAHPVHWFSEPNGDELAWIARLAEAGEIEPPEPVVLPLAQAQTAQEIVRLRATAGRKVTLDVAATARPGRGTARRRRGARAHSRAG